MAKKKKNFDENEIAFGLREATERMADGGLPPKVVDPALSAAAKALSALGASKGGKARAASLSKERRKEIAKKAAIRRWAKKKA